MAPYAILSTLFHSPRLQSKNSHIAHLISIQLKNTPNSLTKHSTRNQSLNKCKELNKAVHTYNIYSLHIAPSTRNPPQTRFIDYTTLRGNAYFIYSRVFIHLQKYTFHGFNMRHYCDALLPHAKKMFNLPAVNIQR